MPTTISGSTGVSQCDTDSVATSDIQNAAVTPAKLSQPLTLGTAQNTTSGTAIDFTGIPSWVKRITVMFNGVSTNGASNLCVRIGAGSVDSTSYSSTLWVTANAGMGTVASSTTEFLVSGLIATSSVIGTFSLVLLSANTWVASGNIARPSDNLGTSVAGTKTLSGTLDRLRLTTVNGTDTFDAGSVNILYEG